MPTFTRRHNRGNPRVVAGGIPLHVIVHRRPRQLPHAAE